MRDLIIVLLVAPAIFIFNDAKAFFAKIDSVYADSCYQNGSYGLTRSDSAAMFSKPDNVFGQLEGNGPQIDLAFKKYNSTVVHPIKGGSTIVVWGKKDLAVDSSAGQI